MAINVFTNIASLNAQRNLATNSASMSKSLQRLSSGMRINSASDDAAGLTISQGLTAQINGLNQASRNAADGLSMLGTAESAISSQTTILQRMRELAVQASSDTNSNTNRSDINSEVTQLKAELDRIARTTSFNGNNLLDGTFQSKDLQVGAYSTTDDRISISFASNKAADIGMAYHQTGSAVTATALVAADVKFTVGGSTYDVGASISDGVSVNTGARDTFSALAKANAINAIVNTTGVSASATTTKSLAQAAGSLTAGDLKINNVSIGAVTTSSTSDPNLVSAINAVSGQTGVTAVLDSSNNVVMTAADGRNIDITAGATATAVLTGAATGTTYGTLELTSTNAFTISGNTVAKAGLTAAAATLDVTHNISTLDLTTKTNAQGAIKTLDVALSQLNSRRAAIGGLTNRLNSTISNLSSASENASASNSRILDADFAQETAAMSRSQVLQQAGVAILAQANQAPQLALSLLR